MKSQPCTINEVKYSSLREGCIALGIDYDNALHHKARKGSKFVMKLVKTYFVEMQETGSVKSSENPESVKKITKD
jgi:hypothetical protein